MTFVNYTKRPELVLADTQSIDPLLVSLLSLCTPHKYEKHIVSVINNLSFMKENVTKRRIDKEMYNQIYIVGEASTVFSCHMDIVGDVGKNNVANGMVDRIFLMEAKDKAAANYGIIYGAKRYDMETDPEPKFIGCPLGADDKVGVYILLKMIEAKIPGMYIFHTGEECGGLGSRSLAAKHPSLFKNINRAIAFDRANYGDVISFQRGGRCCSKEFGEALAAALNVGMPPKQVFKNEVTGTFTDTASYMQLIPECTNISVGYWDQHGPGEHFDAYWVQKWLLPAILKVDFEKLPTKRDPKAVTEYPRYSYSSTNTSYQQNVKQKSWEECKPDDKYFEFPVWKPELGFIEKADPQVLRIAVGRFITNTSYGADRDKFVNWFVNVLEFNAIMADEIISLRASLDIATGKEPIKAEVKEIAVVKLKCICNSNCTSFCTCGKGEEIKAAGEVVYIKDVLADNPNLEKVTLLTELIKVASEPGVVLYGDYKNWLNDYTNKAKKFLRKNRHKAEYSEAEAERFNKVFFALATLIDCSEIHTPAVEQLLNKVEKYVTEHGNEPGLEVPQKLVKYTLEDEVVQHQLVH